MKETFNKPSREVLQFSAQRALRFRRSLSEMVFIAALIGAALLSGFASAMPHPQASPILSTVPGPSTLISSGIGSALSTSQTATQTQSAGSSYVAASSSMGGYGAGSSYGSSYSSNSGVGTSSQWASSSSLATSTASAYGSYSSPAYGSGSSNWGSSGYNDCVAQCVASFGAPAASYMPTATSGSMGTSGSGATITVIVAPTQGVLRYVPFAVNASVGDTIKFMWGANNHTVTKSSELTPCNKTSNAPFASGTQNKGFVFTQVVNDTNTTFYYCGTPGHCQQGMFGIINPPNALGSTTSLSGMMPSLSANSSDVSAYASYTAMMTANNTKAASWGGNIDMGSLPTWSHQYVAENVLFTRNFLASNSEVMKPNGFIDLSSASSTPLMIPQDLGAALSSASTTSPAASSTPMSTATGASMSSHASASASGTAAGLSSGASSLASPNAVVCLLVAVATWFAL